MIASEYIPVENDNTCRIELRGKEIISFDLDQGWQIHGVQIDYEPGDEIDVRKMVIYLERKVLENLAGDTALM